MPKPVILSVDDDQDVLRSIARDLRRQYGKNYRILSAESGSSALEALEELQSKEDPVALLLSDQRMPNMDGVSFLSRAIRIYPESKRVMLTAYADTEAAIQAINRSQVDYYLLKPWDPPAEKLYPVLDDLLEDWQASFKPGFGGLRVIGHRWSAESHKVKDFLARNHVPYQFIDIDTDEGAQSLVASLSEGERPKLPVVFFPGGEKLLAPTNGELGEYIGLKGHATQPFYDVVIAGAGPAGLASAVYAASEGLNTLLIEREAAGGQAGTSSRIENYLGFPSGLSGSDLARRARAQAERFGVEILSPQEALKLRIDGPYKYLTLGDGKEISSHVLMLAMGVAWNRMPAKGAEELTGRGVYYGAALTEAMGCRDSEVYVVGAGNSAGQAAIYFAAYASKVFMIVRGESLGAKMSQYLVDRIEQSPNMEVLLNHEIVECHGDERLEAITLLDRKTKVSRCTPASHLFVFIGAAPRTEWLNDMIACDRQGFVLTGPDLSSEHMKQWPLQRNPFLLETNVPGIFAAGDVRHDSIKRVASAVGEGSVAVHFMHRHLAAL